MARGSARHWAVLATRAGRATARGPWAANGAPRSLIFAHIYVKTGMVRHLLNARSMSIRISPLLTAATWLCTCAISAESQAAPHARDSFYVQLTTGFGLPHFAITADDDGAGAPDRYTATRSDVSAEGSLLLGMPLRPGLVLGVGGIATMSFGSNRDITRNGQPWALVDVKDQLYLFTGMVGPFVDIYPSATLGWHAQALVGYAQASYAQITQHPYHDGSPSGIGLMAGIGHDWWVNEDWSIGLLGRLTYASLRVNRAPFSGGMPSLSEHVALVSPSLEVTFTAH